MIVVIIIISTIKIIMMIVMTMMMMMNELWADHVMMVMIFVTMTRFTDHDCHPGDENRG